MRRTLHYRVLNCPWMFSPNPTLDKFSLGKCGEKRFPLEVLSDYASSQTLELAVVNSKPGPLVSFGQCFVL